MAACAILEEEQGRRPALISRQAWQAVSITQGHPLRREAEALIERVYFATFDVELTVHFPTLIGVTGEHGEIIAAAGCRRADAEPLFLEHYLEAPIEQVLSNVDGAPVSRAEIAEIGNLATNGAGCSPALFSALAAHLRTDGATFAVATATRRLRRAFVKFGFGASEITPAQRARLPHLGREWGRYFDHDPVVVWGRVAHGLRKSERSASL